jgi:hypothetical protein
LYLVFCVISHKRLIALKSNGFYAFSPDHIGWLFFLEVLVRHEELIASLSSKLQSKLALHHSASLSFLQPFTQCMTSSRSCRQVSELVVGCLVYSPHTINQSEEFFRILSTHRMRGIPLAILDKMSNPNYGSIRSLSAVISRSSSIYMGSALVATLISVAITLVTPATCE